MESYLGMIEVIAEPIVAKSVNFYGLCREYLTHSGLSGASFLPINPTFTDQIKPQPAFDLFDVSHSILICLAVQITTQMLAVDDP